MPPGTIKHTVDGEVKPMVSPDNWGLMVLEILRDPAAFVQAHPFIYAVHHGKTRSHYQETVLVDIARLRHAYHSVGCGFIYWSMLREPLSLQISAYNYFFQGGKLLGHDVEFDDIVDFTTADYTIRFLSGAHDQNVDLPERHEFGIHARASDVTLERARADFDLMDFVGFTHRWEDSVFTAMMMLGDYEYASQAYHHLQHRYKNANPCSADIKACVVEDDLTEKQKQQLAWLAQEDSRLFEDALDRFTPLIQAALQKKPSVKDQPDTGYPVILRNNAKGWGCMDDNHKLSPTMLKQRYYHDLPNCMRLSIEGRHKGRVRRRQKAQKSASLQDQIIVTMLTLPVPATLPLLVRTLVHERKHELRDSFPDLFQSRSASHNHSETQQNLATLKQYADTLNCGEIRFQSVFDGMYTERCSDAQCKDLPQRCLRWLDPIRCLPPSWNIQLPHLDVLLVLRQVVLDDVLDDTLELPLCAEPIGCQDACPNAG